jgi:hypothetical protein
LRFVMTAVGPSRPLAEKLKIVAALPRRAATAPLAVPGEGR